MTAAVEVLTLRERVAGDIRAWMVRRGVTGHQLAEELNVSQSYISRRLKGRTAFDIDDLDRIATYLDLPLGIQFGGRPEDAPRPPDARWKKAVDRDITLTRSGRSCRPRGRLWLVGAAGPDHIPVSPGYGSCVTGRDRAAAPSTRTGDVGAVNYAPCA